MSGQAPSNNYFSVFSTTISEIDSDSEHLHIPVTLIGKNRQKEITAMVDSGASTIFLSKDFVERNRVKTIPLPKTIPLYNIDGSRNKMGDITHMAQLGLKLGNHQEEMVAFTIADIGTEDVIIGIDWLREHNPEINWAEGTVTLECCNKPETPKIKPIKPKKKAVPIKEPMFNEDHRGYELANEACGEEDGLDMEWEDEDLPCKVLGKPEAARWVAGRRHPQHVAASS